jgi:hypothetical protein
MPLCLRYIHPGRGRGALSTAGGTPALRKKEPHFKMKISNEFMLHTVNGSTGFSHIEFSSKLKLRPFFLF